VKLLESFRSALKSLRANKMRSGLTMLGIVIGVGFVILLVSLGAGARSEITQGIQGMGSNLIIVVPFKVELDIGSNPMQQGNPSMAVNRFTLNTVDELGRALQRPDSVGIIVQRSTYISNGNRRFFGIINGTDHNEFDIRELETEEGGFFTSADVSSARRVIVLGRTAAHNLFGSEDPIGQFVTIKGRKFKVVGIQAEKGRTMMVDQDAFSYIPFTTSFRVFGGSQPDIILVKAESPETVMDEVSTISETLASSLDDDEFSVITQGDALAFAEDITNILTYLLGGIAAISLLVGGIGIMNIMLVSVTERTREIGVRKAVGAKTGDILLQFLIEAVTLSVLGGIVGIALAIAGSALYELLFHLQTQITVSIILLAFLFSMLVGVFFGVYPARKASRLDPIESLRYE